MAHCVSSPTLTSTGVGTTRSVSSTLSRFVSTPPGSVFTTRISSCSTLSNSTVCATATTVVTQTGTPFTTQVQVAVTVDVPYTFRTTLYGSSCTTTPGAVDTPVSSSTFTPSPIVSTFTSSSIYTSDGSTYISYVTSITTATPEPTITYSTSPSSSTSNNDSKNKTNVPAIVGGTLGGLCAIILLAIVAWKFLKRPPITFDKEDFTKFQHSAKQEQGPGQYQYSPVGQKDSLTSANVFSNGTGLQSANNQAAFHNVGGDTSTQYNGATSNGIGQAITSGNDIGMQPVNHIPYNSNVPSHGPIYQSQTPSLTPGLIAGATAISSARPNSTLSTGYVPGLDSNNQRYSTNINYVPQQYSSYPSGLYPQHQPYAPQPIGVQGQDQRPLSHNFSVGSHISGTSRFTGNNTGVDYTPSLMVQPPNQPQQELTERVYGDSFSGSQSVGSGSSDNRALQITNPGMETTIQDPSHIAGASSSTSTPTPIDGKGQPLDTRGEKSPIVHLDGGAYNDPSNSAPPAYQE